MNDLDFWNQRLDDLRAQCSPQTDVELSFLIRISPGMISQIRTGRREPPFETKVKILESLGYVFDNDLVVRLLPAEHRKVIVSANQRIKKRIPKSSPSANAGKALPSLDGT